MLPGSGGELREATVGPSGEGSRDRALAPSIAERDALLLLLLLLAGVAGCVYALSYLGLG